MLLRICLIWSICLAGAIAGVSLTRTGLQRGVRRVNTNQTPKASPTPRVTSEPTPEPTTKPSPEEVPNDDPNSEQQDVESLKIDTNLVTVPVIATTREGIYIPDLRQEEFDIAEDGKQQQIAFFATVSAPFHVVLLLDTSASTEQTGIRKLRRGQITRGGEGAPISDVGLVFADFSSFESRNSSLSVRNSLRSEMS